MTNAIETLSSPILQQILDASMPQSLVAGMVCAGAYTAAYFTSWLGGVVWRCVINPPSNTFINHPVLKMTSKLFGVDRFKYHIGKGTYVSYSKKGDPYESYVPACCIFSFIGILLLSLLPILLWLLINFTTPLISIAGICGGIYLARSARRTQKTLKAHMEDIQAHKKTRK